MASACCPPIADGYPYVSIFELGMEPSKPSASSSEAEAAASMDDRQFQPTPPMGQFSRSGCTINLFDDEAFFPLRKSPAHTDDGLTTSNTTVATPGRK